MCAQNTAHACRMPALSFITAKGQAFLTVPSFHQRSLSPRASRRTNSPTGLLGRLRLFMNRTSPPLQIPIVVTHTLPSFALVCRLFSVPVVFLLSHVSFLSISQPRSLLSNWRHGQSHLDYSEDHPGLTSLPVKEETAIPRGSTDSLHTKFHTTASLPRIHRGSAHCVPPPPLLLFTQPLPNRTAQRNNANQRPISRVAPPGGAIDIAPRKPRSS